MSLWGNDFVVMLGTMPAAAIPDKKFMSMFMGLVDGDGYIEIGPQKQYNLSSIEPRSTIRARLVLRLHSRDTDLITYLTKVLSIGSISSLKSVNQTRLIITKKDLTTVIIPLIKLYNLNFLTSNRIRQYGLLNYTIENKIIHWEDMQLEPSYARGCKYSVESLLKLDFFEG
jgi:hypothetical protein